MALALALAPSPDKIWQPNLVQTKHHCQIWSRQNVAATVEPRSYEPLGIFEMRDCEIFISLKLNGVLMEQSSCMVY